MALGAGANAASQPSGSCERVLTAAPAPSITSLPNPTLAKRVTLKNNRELVKSPLFSLLLPSPSLPGSPSMPRAGCQQARRLGARGELEDTRLHSRTRWCGRTWGGQKVLETLRAKPAHTFPSRQAQGAPGAPFHVFHGKVIGRGRSHPRRGRAARAESPPPAHRRVRALASPSPAMRALRAGCSAARAFTPAIAEVSQRRERERTRMHPPLLLSHTRSLICLSEHQNPFLSWALGLLASRQLFFPNSEPGKMIEPVCVAKRLVSTGSEGKNGAASSPPHFLPLAKRPGSI